jgi:Flp pilus assembly pilin Flp
MAIEPGAQPKPPETSRLTPRREETVMDLIMKFTFEEAGASAVEYALLLAFIAVIIAGSVLNFGTAVKGLFDNAAVRFAGG